jgi:hypothetical protein
MLLSSSQSASTEKGMKASDLVREIVHGAAVSWLSFPVDRVSKL